MSLIRNLVCTLEQKSFDFSDQQAMLVTIDPENDSPEIIDKYAKAFNQNFIGARANRPMLIEFSHSIKCHGC